MNSKQNNSKNMAEKRSTKQKKSRETYAEMARSNRPSFKRVIADGKRK